MGTNNSRVPEWRLGKCLLIVAAHSVPADRRIGVFVALPPRTRTGGSNALTIRTRARRPRSQDGAPRPRIGERNAVTAPLFHF